MILEKLYAMSSNGKIKTWKIEANGSTMIIRNGYEGSKIAEQTKEIKGKNLGRTNETTPEEQCLLECKSKWQKKIDEQYTPNRAAIMAYSDQEILLPMLALNYRDRKHDIVFPCYIQPKLNGVRCIYQNGKFMSRKGKEYTTLSHLIPELKKLGIKIPDGEIYMKDVTFQEIIRRVKKDRGADSTELEYWIYDQINNDTFENRTNSIDSHFRINKFIKLVRVETILVNSEAEIKKYHDLWVSQGFEGAIIRNVAGKYKVKHRSADLQKYKEFFDAEFEIVGAHEGTGTDVGTAVFEVRTKGGTIFSVRPKGTRELRSEYLSSISNLIGKELTVRYQNLSEDGIPIFPVGLAIRDYE